MELAYCVPRGIPHSRFLGGPDVWTPEDRDKVAAFLADDARLCKRCGTRPEEWDPKAGGDRHAFVAEPVRCFGCETLQQAEREIGKGDDAPSMLGLSLVLVPNTPDDEDAE